jgi:hypothetical protein
MAFATVTKYEPEAWHYAKPVDLVHGDLVARVNDNGVVAPRVLLRPGGKGTPSTLGYPKRMEPTGIEGEFGTYVNDDGQVLVIGHVKPPEAKAESTPKAKRNAAKASERNTTPDTTSTPHEAAPSNGPSGRMTKATAADAIDAISLALIAQAEAMQAVAASLR